MPKKKTTATNIAKPRQRTSGESCFWVNNGPVVESIAGLKRTLAKMSDEQFVHHTGSGNDFARWLHDVLHHSDCARRITRAKTAQGALRVLMVCRD